MAKNKRNGSIGGYLVLAGLFIGVGVGVTVDNTAAGTLIGIGAGFLAAFFYAMIKGK